MNESIQEIVRPELMFSQDHNLLMYLKAILTQDTVLENENDSEDSKVNDSDSSESVLKSDDEKLIEVTTKFRKSDFQ